VSDHKIAGCCTLCDKPCFEVMQVNDPHERNPGEPKRLGQPMNDSARITFLLYDGTKTDLTFCGECADLPLAPLFIELWAKNMRTWLRELGNERPEWFMKQYTNGLLCEIGRKTWKELVKRNG
jgi:hypothetical protein